MDLEGRTLGEFTLRDKIGEGGFAVVHKAYQAGLEREAVVKVLHARLAERGDVIQRFLREARLASRLDHPYAAHVYAFGAESDGTLWIAMEMVHGTPMDRLLETQGPIALDRFVPLFERISEVVQTAHERGIVHRDLKPGNVMVLARAGQLLPKLLDFGIARVVEDGAGGLARTAAPGDAAGDGRTTRAGAVMGSPLYMAPEQWADAGSVGPATDIYALGVLAYEALTGRVPFSGASLETVMTAHATHEVPALGNGLPDTLDAVLARAMAKQPAERYGTAVDFAAALRAASGLGGDGATLPLLDEPLREAMAAGAPQPLAEAVAALEGARNIDQACAILWDVVLVTVRWIGVVALASRTKIGPGSDADGEAVTELLREIGRGAASEDHWLALARALTRPFLRRSAAYPIPALVPLLHGAGDRAATPPLDSGERSAATPPEGVGVASLTGSAPGDPGPPFVEAYRVLRGLRAALDRRAGKTDEQRRDLYAQALAALADLLRPLRFLLEYTVVVPRKGRCERWRGIRRTPRPAVVRRAKPLPDGHCYVLDPEGAVVLQLMPLVQAAEPAPGKDRELFVFDGKGPDGARLVAIPHGFEHHDPVLGDWFRTHLFDASDGSDRAIEVEAVPYRGLAAFTAEDSSFYFGREREVEAFVNRLRVEPFLAVVGPSGAGKSSFVQAGVVPRLPTNWRAIVVRPGPAPLAALEGRLQKSAVDARDLAADPSALAAALRATTEREGSTIVLVIDQLEELFTLCRDDRERQAYAAALAEISRSSDDAVRVVVTLRDDFLIQADALVPLRDRLARGIKLLTTPAPEDLERILVEPAKRAGYQFEDVGLVGEMVDAVAGQPGALALLSFTAAELWTLRDRQFRQISRQAYGAIGGVGGALARHAESTLADMTAEEKRLTREAFRHLVTAEGTRQVLKVTELRQLLSGGGRADAVIDRLTTARLVVIAEEAGGDERVEIIHEALLAAWPRLVEWRKEDAEGARMRDQLRTAARQWDARGRPKGLLWRADALAEYRIWRARYPGALTDVEDTFGKTSVADAARGTRIRRGLLITAFAVLAVGLTITLRLRQKAADESERATAQSVLASQRANEIQANLVKIYEDQGRQQLLDGNSSEALAYLAEAFRLGDDRPAVRFMIARALAPLEAEVATLSPSSGPLRRIAFSPDGRQLVTAGDDGQPVLWKAEGIEIRRLVGHAAAESAVAWSPDGSVLYTGDANGVLRSWNIDGTLRAAAVPTGKSIRWMTVSADGSHVAASSVTGQATIWRTADLVAVASWIADPEGFDDIQFDPTGTRVLTASRSGVAALWTRDGQLVARLAGHTQMVWFARFSPAGDQVITTSIDGTARLWNARTGQLRHVLRGHEGRVTHAVFEPRGRWVATAGADKTARTWDSTTAEPLVVLRGHTGQVNRVLPGSRPGELITVALDGTARVWDADFGLPLATFFHDGFVFDASISADGKRLATAIASSAGTGKIWDLERLSRIASFRADVTARVRFTQGASALIVADKEVSLWTSVTGEVRRHSTGAAIADADVSADGRSIAFADATSVTVATPEGVETFATDAPVHAVSLDATGTRLATVSDRTVVVRDLVSMRELARRDFAQTVAEASFSKTGVLVGLEVDGTASMLSDRLEGPTLHPPKPRAGSYLAEMAPDGSALAVLGPEGGWLWTPDGRLLATLAHEGAVFSIAWSPDSRRLLTGSVNGSISRWDAPTWQRTDVREHDAYVMAIDVSADGGLFATLGADQLAMVWDMETLSPIFAMSIGNEPMAYIDLDPAGLLIGGKRGVDLWRLDRFTGTPAALVELVRCRVPYEIVDGRRRRTTPRCP